MDANLISKADLLGVDYDESTTESELRAAVASVLNARDLIKEKAPAAKKQASAVKPKEKEDDAMQKVKIMVHESERDKRPCVVGLNGRNYVIPRGTPVEVPKAVMMILDNAKQRVWTQDMSASYMAPRYPYQLMAS